VNACTPLRTLDGLLQDFASAPAIPVSGLALDSRRVRGGDAFFALRGQRAHGLQHAQQAVARGAAAIVWEPAEGVVAPSAAVPQFAVEQLSWHLGEIAARFHGRAADRLFIAGITGTDGKTSTAHLVAQILDHAGMGCAYIGTLGTGRLDRLDEATHTTPDALSLHERLAELVQEGAQACAMEVSSHALDQNRVGGLRFDAAVLTNLGRDHLDYHGDLEYYARAKRRLFEAGAGGALIFNRDDARGAQWSAEFGADPDARVTVYGLDGAAPSRGDHVIGRDLQLDEHGMRLRLDTSWGEAVCRAPLLGRFNAYNLMAAMAVVLASGVALDRAVEALQHLRTVPGRIEGFRRAGAPLVVVDYAHTPQALEQILLALRPHARRRLVCVFGCGGDRDPGKRPLMGAAAARLADALVVTDDNPRSESPETITQAILSGVPAGASASVVHDRAEAIRTAVRMADPGDVIVVAGKGHERTQTYGAEVRPFSDREFVTRLLQEPAGAA
jgi:UDP-N-acetylmuramoyl-L-alanyl-D-glutamate--2,6-diaminopimelate ligase